MRIRSVIAFVAGSIAVHAAVSCASSSSKSGVEAADAIADVVRDVLGGDSVAEAGPADPKPTVDEVPCDKTFAGVGAFAEKAFPGRAATDLARGVALVCGAAGGPPGACSAQTLWTSDGFVWVNCRADYKVKIIMPPTP